MSDYVNTIEAAKLAGISTSGISKAIQKGTLKSHGKDGRDRQILRSEFKAWNKARKTKKGRPKSSPIIQMNMDEVRTLAPQVARPFAAVVFVYSREQMREVLSYECN